MNKPIRVFSFGGGVQSHAVLALQAQGKLLNPYDMFVFANVGHDSENPDTLKYLEQVTIPFCEEFNIKFVEVRKIRRNGQSETLMEYIYRTEKSVPIPARMSNGAPGNRSCTSDFKISVVDKFIRSLNVTHAEVGIGISMDEIGRMRDEHWHDRQGKKKFGFMKRRVHPLIDLRMSREMCKSIIDSAGLPVPPKSSCFFCPFMKRTEWIDLEQNKPDLFQKAVELEKHINKKRAAMGRDRVYLHSSAKPLQEAVLDQLPIDSGLTQLDMFNLKQLDISNVNHMVKAIAEAVQDDDLDNCDGYCMT